MPLVQLVYASHVASNINVDEIKTIVAEAAKKNTTHDLTGFLCANPKFFLQCLEGDREQVNRLYLKIANDARHHQVSLIKYDEIETRSFADWSMGVVTQVDSHKDLILRYNHSEIFNPYHIPASQCIALLLELSLLRRGFISSN